MTERDNWKYKLVRYVASLLDVDLVDAWRAPAYGRDTELMERAADCNLHVEALKAVAEKYDHNEYVAVADLADFMDADPAEIFPELDEGQLEVLRRDIEGKISIEQNRMKNGEGGSEPAHRIKAFNEVLEDIDEVKDTFNEQNE